MSPNTACALTLLTSFLSATSLATQQADLVIVPHLPTEVRVGMPVPAQVLIYNPNEDAGAVQLEHLAVSVGQDMIGEVLLDRELPGGREYGEVQALLERLPEELTELHRQQRYFATAEAAAFVGLEVLTRRDEVAKRIRLMRAEYEAGKPQPFVQPIVTVPLDQVFESNSTPGTRATLLFTLSYRDASGQPHSVETASTLTWHGVAPSQLTGLTSFGSGVSVHAGDLHVHSCYGEALDACGDGNCYAETFQVSGSFTYAELKPQYQSLGMDWFTATDHSYCINSSGEYNNIRSDANALNDASFVCLPDIEVSSDEGGSQTGSDDADIVCIWLTESNHMGAHGISSRIEGGSDSLFGFCDGLFTDELDDFRNNIARVRDQGGFPIIHHPYGYFAWNSYAETRGIESNAAHGVEIWNADADGNQTGQDGAVGRWIDWMREGRILYAYAGSDTHDEAHAAGANYAVLLGEPFTPENLENAVRAGQVYVSNGPALTIEVDEGAQTIFMGSRHPVTTGSPPATLTVRAAYDFGSATGTVTVFAGRNGDGSETVLGQGTALTGSGTVAFTDTLSTDRVSWYRAYLEVDGGSQSAYSNPVFFTLSEGNDHCANATPLNGDGVFPVDNTFGTGPDADPGCGNMGADVWFDWTAGVTGTVTMDLCGSGFDTTMAAWEGPFCPTTLLACDDDTCGSQSMLSFPCTAGSSYMIQIGGYSGAAGTGNLTVGTIPDGPANDNCATPELINGQGSFNYDNTWADTDGPPDALCDASGFQDIIRDVWYEWTADDTGTATLSTCAGAGGDTKIAAYDGAGCPAASPLACNDDSCGTASQISFAVVSGNTYMLRIGAFPMATGGAGFFDLAIQGSGGCNDSIFCLNPPNSSGGPATLAWSGSCAVSDNNFSLEMAGGPANKPGLFIYGAGQAATPLGNGILCIASPIIRLNPPVFMDGAGAASRSVDLANPPTGSGAITAGSTWHFQMWLRDPDGGGAGFTFTDGLALTFQ